MFCSPTAIPGKGVRGSHRRPCAFGSPSSAYRTALPFCHTISSQITSELWRAYFSLSQQFFFSYPPGFFWAERDSWSLEPSSWLVTCFPVAREEFPEDERYACWSQGNWGAAKPSQQAEPGKAPHTLSPEERNVSGNWEYWSLFNSAVFFVALLASSPVRSSACHKNSSSKARKASLWLQSAAPQGWGGGGMKRVTGEA